MDDDLNDGSGVIKDRDECEDNSHVVRIKVFFKKKVCFQAIINQSINFNGSAIINTKGIANGVSGVTYA